MFKCQFPNCNYSCDNRQQIHYHHIIPSSDGGSNEDYNRIYLCPNCHHKIYIPNSTSGIHATKHKNSIVLLGWRLSTEGKILEYINENGNITYY